MEAVASEKGILELPLPGGEAMRLVRLLGCAEEGFLMGSRGHYADEQPVHRVYLSGPFYLGETPVTQRQFRLWRNTEVYEAWLDGAIRRKDVKAGHQNHFESKEEDSRPADSVTWYEAIAFGAWLTEVAADALRPLGLVATLPTEAQWEYACRANTRGETWIGGAGGDGAAALEEIAWWDGNSGGRTHPVGRKAPNPWGFYDLIGNVWEWCLDGWSAQAYRKRVWGIKDPVVRAAQADDPKEGYLHWIGFVELLDRLLKNEVSKPMADPAFVKYRDWLFERCSRNNSGGWDAVRALVYEIEQGISKGDGSSESFTMSLEAETQLRGFRDEIHSWCDFREGEVLRVARGGSWSNPAANCRSSSRDRPRPGIRVSSRGFRVCLAPGPAAEPPLKNPR